MSPPVARAVAPARRSVDWLPQGRALSDAEFAWRHRFVCWLLALHLPALPLTAVLAGRSLEHGLAETAPVLGLLVVATSTRPGRYFVAVAVIALYQDWAVYALAIAFVTLQHGVFGVLAQHSVYDHGGNPWGWALVHAAFVLAESAVLVVFWHANEKSRATEDNLRAQLSDGQTSVRARLAETDQMRADLIATVSHEFRTPLTGIRGAALTLLKRGDRLDVQSRQRLLTAVLDQQEKLSRLLENMLTAAKATHADPTAVAEVDAVAAEVAMLAGASRPEVPTVSIVVEPHTRAHIDRHALHQVLANLVDNAQQHGSRGAVPIVAAGTDADGVWLSVSNEGRTIDLTTTGRLLEPFTQAASGATREAEGMGMGLFVVRRLVEVYGGTVHVQSENGWFAVELRLRAAGAPVPPARTPVRTG
ncbi:MAG: HAMP domain-containing histidine kinase [Actinobacteria bacterium]|nr:HAMP domain-containing histidine kinase [Actinomycetota bacterium]